MLVGVLVCAGSGLLVAIVVAWLLAAFVSVPMYPRDTVRAFAASGRVWHVVEVHKPGVVDAWWGMGDAESADPRQQVAAFLEQSRVARPGRATPRTIDKPPSWGTMRHPTPAVGDIGSDSAFGWPFPCLWYQVTGELSQNSAGQWQIDGDKVHGGLLIKGEPSARGRDFRALPLRPILLGMVLNTLVFATPAWIGFFGWPRMRGWLRRRKGQCASCGYDRQGVDQGSPCPECGAPDGTAFR